MRSVEFTEDTLADFTDWIVFQKTIGLRLKKLIAECCRTPFEGTGKPEPLKGKQYANCWSRRITDADRLVYRVTDERIYIISCKGHYGDK